MMFETENNCLENIRLRFNFIKCFGKIDYGKNNPYVCIENVSVSKKMLRYKFLEIE